MPPDPTITTLLRDHYFQTGSFTIQPITRGEENHNFHIITDGGAFVLRLYSLRHSTTGLRRKVEIDFEIAFIEHLRGESVPTPAVIPSLGGGPVTSTIIDGQTRFAVLFEHVQGEHAPGYTPQVARSVAETLLHMRRASRGFAGAPVRPWPGDIVALSLDGYAQNRENLMQHRTVLEHRQALDAMYDSAVEGYRQIKADRFPTGVVHGDIKLDNLLFVGGRVQAVLDFDDYRATYLLEELTRTIMHDLDSPTRNAIRAGQFGEFLSVIEQDYSITPAEHRHLRTFLRARFLYDVSAYAASGLTALVDEVMADTNVAAVIFG